MPDFSTYHALGFSPFPVVRGDKKPACEWKPYQTTRATPEQCAVWDKQGFNIGLATGKISGFIVLDVDGEEGQQSLAELEATHGALPETITAQSGKGKHYYFQMPNDGREIRNLSGRSVYGEVLPSLDVRGDGGYIIAPPSLHPNGNSYCWINSPEDTAIAPAPEWLLELVAKPPEQSFLAREKRAAFSHAYLETALADELASLRKASNGTRNDTLNKAAFSLGQLVAHGLPEARITSELMHTATAIGLDHQEAQNTITSGLCAGMAEPRQPSASQSRKKETTWEAPILFDSIQTPPIDPALLPSELSEFSQDLALATETPVEMAIACVLGVSSVALAGKYVVSPKSGWHEHLNTYWFIELPPANLKSKVIRSCTAPLVKWERIQKDKLAPEIKRKESIQKSKLKYVDKMREKAAKAEDATERNKLYEEIAVLEAEIEADPIPVLPRLFANNVTPEALENLTYEQGGVFSVISDEGGVLEVITGLYSNGRANVDMVLKGIDGGDVRIKRKDRDITMNPLLTFILCVQPVVREKMGRNPCLQGNGALERFLYVLPRSKIGYRTHNKPPVPEAVQQRYNATIMRLLNVEHQRDEQGHLTPRVLTLSPDAFRLFYASQLWLEPQLKEGGELYPLQGWGGKIAGFSLRLAGLIHVISTKGQSLQIQAETMQSALSIAKALTDHAKAAYLFMGQDETAQHAQHILAWITSRGLTRFRRGELTSAMRHHAKAKQLDEAITELVERNIIQAREEQGKGTKPVTVYAVNPAMYATQIPTVISETSECSTLQVSELSEHPYSTQQFQEVRA